MIATSEKSAGLEARVPSLDHVAGARRRSEVRVWLTDDNHSLRSTLTDLLERTGEFNCNRQFHSAEALLEALAREPAPDAILLDVEMGGMTGVEALPQIRALAPTVRVLILTSFFDAIYEARAASGGAAAFLLKSYALQRIADEIHRALALPLRAVEPVEASSPARPVSGTSLREKPSILTRLAGWARHIPRLFLPGTYHHPATK